MGFEYDTFWLGGFHCLWHTLLDSLRKILLLVNGFSPRWKQYKIVFLAVRGYIAVQCKNTCKCSYVCADAIWYPVTLTVKKIVYIIIIIITRTGSHIIKCIYSIILTTVSQLDCVTTIKPRHNTIALCTCLKIDGNEYFIGVK